MVPQMDLESPSDSLELERLRKGLVNLSCMLTA